MRLFESRQEAALELAAHLRYLKDERPLVLGLARGGVPIASTIAHELDAPMDVLLTERLPAPSAPHQIVGAVDEHGRISIIQSTARWHRLTPRELVGPARDAFRDIQRLRGRVRTTLPELDVRDRSVIITCQCVVTGAKMLGAIASVRDRGARKVIVAAPAGAGDSAWQMHEAADLVVIPHRLAKFNNVEDLYRNYLPVTDDLLVAIVEQWVSSREPTSHGVQTLAMKMTNDRGDLLCCEIDLPPGAKRDSGPYPAVLFAHDREHDAREPRIVATSLRLAKRGVIGVRPHFTGHGRSEGSLENATPDRMAQDFELSLQSVRQLHEVDVARIGLVGSGSGARIVIDLAQRDPSIRTVVTRGPMIGGEREASSRLKIPCLTIHAEEDRLNALGGLSLEAPLPDGHEVLEIPEASRTFLDPISAEMMVGATVDWMVDHLTDHSTTHPPIEVTAERHARTPAHENQPKS